VVGFYFLDLASNYEPPDNVKRFLDEGEPPIYIGYATLVHFRLGAPKDSSYFSFGSIVIEEPKEMTR
jgi:hypothetical protein